MLEKVRLINKMKIRMKRRKISTRIFQMCVVTVVVTMFLYFLFQAGLSRTPPPEPDYSWLNTRNVSHFIRPKDETALVEPPSCGNKDVRLLVVVFSAPGNAAARYVIRRTWGKKLKDLENVRLMYIVGRAKQSELYNKVLTEAEDNGDLLIEDFEDTYQNLTLKTTFMLKWTSRHCSQAKFVFKVDDDVYVNPKKVMETLESTHLYFKKLVVTDLEGIGRAMNVDYAMVGSVMNTVPIRDPTSKWYLSLDFYPLNIFPKFLSGTGYIFTGSLATPLLYCAVRTPFINLEDVFLSGLCATTQLGLRLTHSTGFQWRPMIIGGTHICNYKQSVIVHGSFAPEKIEEIFARTQDDVLCDTLLFSFMEIMSSFTDSVRSIFRI